MFRNIVQYTLCLALAILFTTNANATRVFGTAEEYANAEIKFYKYQDRITFLKDEVFTVKFDSNGVFDCSFDVDKITYVFAEFGIYFTYFYAEPDKSYELIFPEYVNRNEGDMLNPFFTPTEMQIGMKNLAKTDLNYLILDFDYFYNKYHDLNLNQIYRNGLESDIDTFINKINLRYENVDNQYFKEYKKFRIAALKNIATQKQYESVLVYSHYTKNDVLYDNPAYMDLFNNIYDDYFDKYLVSPRGASLYAVINYGHSISRLNRLLSEDVELRTPQFRELVMLKGINDAFSNDNLKWLPLLLTLDSLYISTKYPEHKMIAQNIADNILTMAKGTIALPFELPDTAGDIRTLAEFKGKCLYIEFANTQSYTSQIEFESLKKIYDRYKGVCLFVTILTDKDKERAKKFIVDNELKWTFLFAEDNSKVLSDYKVSTFPTYFFIDKYGTLVLSPAPAPSENFEKYLFRYLEKMKKAGK